VFGYGGLGMVKMRKALPGSLDDPIAKPVLFG
jgi:hypothetical protein